MLRLLVVDGHAIARVGIRQILVEHFKAVVLGEAENGRSGLDAIRGGSWDLVLLEMMLPDADGHDVLRQALSIDPTLRILIVTIQPAARFARRALASGAFGYLTKDIAAGTLIESIETVLDGRRLVPSTGSGRLGNPHDNLSQREIEVLRLFGEGLTAAQIADRLRLSAKTVGTYRARLLSKLGLASTAQLIRYAILHDFAPLP